ncbi:hypothetical protein EDC94DRAFT_651913 [Helicostylum pulchrum]|nr:hypothetical protein EDC94DRAFT_651913 [Helicostylum pulchrum]
MSGHKGKVSRKPSKLMGTAVLSLEMNFRRSLHITTAWNKKYRVTLNQQISSTNVVQKALRNKSLISTNCLSMVVQWFNTQCVELQAYQREQIPRVQVSLRSLLHEILLMNQLQTIIATNKRPVVEKVHSLCRRIYKAFSNY